MPELNLAVEREEEFRITWSGDSCAMESLFLHLLAFRLEFSPTGDEMTKNPDVNNSVKMGTQDYLYKRRMQQAWEAEHLRITW